MKVLNEYRSYKVRCLIVPVYIVVATINLFNEKFVDLAIDIMMLMFLEGLLYTSCSLLNACMLHVAC